MRITHICEKCVCAVGLHHLHDTAMKDGWKWAGWAGGVGGGIGGLEVSGRRGSTNKVYFAHILFLAPSVEISEGIWQICGLKMEPFGPLASLQPGWALLKVGTCGVSL